MTTRDWKFSAILTLVITLGLLFAPAIPMVEGQGGVTGFANLRISNFYRAQPRTAITVTNGGTVNPTGTYTRLTAAGAVAASLVAEPAGSVLILVNTGSNTITFTETATLISAGNIALGAGDSATLISDGTAWTQIAASNN